MRFLLTLFVLFVVMSTAFSQDSTYTTSRTVDLPLSGVFRVLQIRNGNTVLFHFKARKPVIVKIFDEAHKEIASCKHTFNLLNINALNQSVFKGFYDINGKAVFFIEQEIDNKNILFRVRINAMNGQIIEEKMMVQSSSIGNTVSSYILKDNKSDNYSLFCFSNIIHYPANKIELIHFTSLHQATDTVFFNPDVKDRKYIYLLGVNNDAANGVCITACIADDDVTSRTAPYTTYKTDLVIAYLPPHYKKFIAVKQRLSPDINPVSVGTTYNAFANSINTLIFSVKKEYFNNGFQSVKSLTILPLLFTLQGSDLSINATVLTNHKIDDFLRQKYDTNTIYRGFPLSIFTNERGITTVFYEDICPCSASQSRFFGIPYYCHGNIGITQYDDKGAELWGSALPKLSINLSQDPFIGEFFGTNIYRANKSFFLFNNDYPQNMDRSIGDTLLPVTDYSYANGFIYRMYQNKIITKRYLFGKPNADESKINFLSSADFKEQTNIYATLMLQRNGDNYSLHMAWCDLNKL